MKTLHLFAAAPALAAALFFSGCELLWDAGNRSGGRDLIQLHLDRADLEFQDLRCNMVGATRNFTCRFTTTESLDRIAEGLDLEQNEAHRSAPRFYEVCGEGAAPYGSKSYRPENLSQLDYILLRKDADGKGCLLSSIGYG